MNEEGIAHIMINRESALDYHARGRPGKLEVIPTKPVANQVDLSLAYTPGVAVPVLEIAGHPDDAYRYTAKSNLVAVISDGSAILGLGNRGALASKPVMEGKAVLFKRFADVDVFDIEVNAANLEEFIHVVQAIAPTFGGINLEDIKAPECFVIEAELKRTLDIPVFHDDQHGTAIIATAGLLNALEVVGKRKEEVAIVINGAGAAAIACAKMFVLAGFPRDHITMLDTHGVIYAGRAEGMNEHKAQFARPTQARTLADAIRGADVFVGLSVGDVVSTEMVRSMARQPIIFAMANPDPEIPYELARQARPDAVVATGRSDYPNQINNVLGFPFIFRGALDVHARQINEEMKLAACYALAALAREEVPEEVLRAYRLSSLQFGAEYVIPKPLDPRVLLWEAPAVAEAAMKTGVARRHIDLNGYRAQLEMRQARLMRLLEVAGSLS
ncbi:MAG: malic enzyme-like NAD(P)-binding protein [Anaerolineae bacterium]